MSNAIHAMKAKLASGSEWNGRFWLAWYGHKTAMIMLSILLTASLLCLALPKQAHADFLADINNNASAIMNVILSLPDAPNYLMTNAGENMKAINTGQLTNDFDSLIGKTYQYSLNGQNTSGSPYGFVESVHETVVEGFGYSVLVIVYLVQLVRLANKFESNGVMPQVKEVIFLLLGFVIMKYLIDNSLTLCDSVYTAINQLISKLPGYSGTSTYDTNLFGQAGESGFFEDNNWLGNMLVALFVWIASWFSQIVAYFVVFARALQIYIYAIMAPIPLAFLGMEETRSWGVGFIKSFLAACLAGVFIALIVLMWPMCVASVTGDGDSWVLAEAIALCLLLSFALIKTGSWARELLGS